MKKPSPYLLASWVALTMCGPDPVGPVGTQRDCSFPTLRAHLVSAHTAETRVREVISSEAHGKRHPRLGEVEDAARSVVSLCRSARFVTTCVPAATGPRGAVAACSMLSDDVLKLLQRARQEHDLASEAARTLEVAYSSVYVAAPSSVQHCMPASINIR